MNFFKLLSSPMTRIRITRFFETLIDRLHRIAQPSFTTGMDPIKLEPLEKSGHEQSVQENRSSSSGSETAPAPGTDQSSHLKQSGEVMTELDKIEIKCPECGAPLMISESMYTLKCAFCSSLLIIEKHGSTLYFQMTNRITSKKDVLKTLEDFYANRYYSEQVSRTKHASLDSNNPHSQGDLFADMVFSEAARLVILNKVKKLRQRFRDTVRLETMEYFFAPYWNVDGIVGSGFLGRNKRTGDKHLEPRFFQLEFTSPAYDDTKINLRDTGLRISGSSVKMLRRSDTAEHFPFLEPLPFREDLFKQAEFWFRRIPWGELQPIQNRSRFLHRRARLVFKPFCIVKYSWDGDIYFNLLDGANRAVAGNLVYKGDQAMSGFIEKDRGLYPEGDIEAKMIPSECPVCNYEQHYRSDECIHFCENCYRALELSRGKIEELSYYFLDNGLVGNRQNPNIFLPFWAFELYLTFSMDGTTETCTLGSYLHKLGKKMKGKPEYAGDDNLIFVPALKHYGGMRPDEMFCRIVKDVTNAKKRIVTDKLNLDVPVKFTGATLTREEATDLIPFLLYGLFDQPTAMRMNKRTVQKYLENITVHIDTSFLILVPFQEQNRQYINPVMSFGIPVTFMNGTWMKEWIRTAYFRKRRKNNKRKRGPA